MGIAAYPTIAPPQVVISATYPGASADTVEKTVTQVIEPQLTGIDHLLYFTSQSSANGTAQITLTFEVGTDPDIAQVQVQNKLPLATPRLPDEVNKQGVEVVKNNPDFLLFIALLSSNPEIDAHRLDDIIASQLLEPMGRISGVGHIRHLGSEYAMRIWLNPDKLRGYGLSATQVRNAIATQNVQFAAGAIGSDPAINGQGLSIIASAEGRFNTPDQFENIILRADPNGTTVKLKDVAKMSFGPQTYGTSTRWSGIPTGAFGIQLLPGANALDVEKVVLAKMQELEKNFPEGVTWVIPYNTTPFVKRSIKEVLHTLVEATALVFIVVFIFLQNIRATIIPTLIIPVALLGTFIGLLALGFSINQLSLFGMVLAIGIVVDDAIVVIENVERIMTEEGLSPKDASRKAMGQITGAIIAITVVLIAVFVPSTFQPGASGIIYKQFALTIAVSMGLSAVLALSFTPALCASFLEPVHEEKKNFIFRGFNTGFDKITKIYINRVNSAIRHTPRWMIAFTILVLLVGFLYPRLPTSFVPDEDQGFVLAVVSLPPGASIQRTKKVNERILKILEQEEGYEGVFQISGFSFVGSGENVGMDFVHLTDWSTRKVTAAEFINRVNPKLYAAIPEAQIFVINLPTIRGLSQFGGIDMYLQAQLGQATSELLEAQNIVTATANRNPVMTAVRPNTLAPSPQLQFKVDRVQAESMGLSVSDIYNALSMMLAPVYINDFYYGGRVKRVFTQADIPYRMGLDALHHFYTPSTQMESNGLPQMISISNVIDATWEVIPPTLSRYNGYPAIEIVGAAAPGHASGEAMKEIEKIVRNDLPKGFGFDWTGLSYQEVLAGDAGMFLIGLSIVIVFLALAALYESWSIPVAVILVVPLGLLGIVLFSFLRNLPNDIYFNIGVVAVVGLAAKNAILIIEFAVDEQKAGRSLGEAVITAARLRLRPIIMTSIAFIGGVFPLVISTGAGASARQAIGTGVTGGMLFATFFGVLLIPVFYVVVRRLLGDQLEPASPQLPQHTAQISTNPSENHEGNKPSNN
ncbi:multidrug transporter [Candidatus Nitrosoglobus terrae]|uniref:Efflux pump membrane transporter n=2 Tax=Candidatus Nitrosoglobus terrae TaxID=1630141 RepID=A0A1Q2SL44_9GAMM|nr:multidrug transporter [Candidatus Nitrosoglobus terrae]